MTDAQIILALGDAITVASRLSIPKSTVANWKSRGIPWKWRQAVKDLARKSKVGLPEQFLYEKALS